MFVAIIRKIGAICWVVGVDFTAHGLAIFSRIGQL